MIILSYRVGSGYKGSPELEFSTTEHYEVIPKLPDKSLKENFLYKFSFFNDQDCTVIINDGDPIYLRANQGFQMDENDALIYSFVIVEEGISFNWIGAW